MALGIGMPNIKGDFIIMLGGTRWRITNRHQIPVGERVRETRQKGDVLDVASAYRADIP